MIRFRRLRDIRGKGGTLKDYDVIHLVHQQLRARGVGNEEGLSWHNSTYHYDWICIADGKLAIISQEDLEENIKYFEAQIE